MPIIFEDFIVQEKASINLIEENNDNIPAQVVEVWEKFGFGTIHNGYLRVIKPDDFVQRVPKAQRWELL